MYLLYPSSPSRRNRPDEQFAAEVEAMRAVGFEISLFSLEDFQTGTFDPFPPLPPSSAVLYRGWMLSGSEYRAFASAITHAGAEPVVDLESYLASHHLPNWYATLADLTPETRIYPPDCDLTAELRGLGWSSFFIKDYVKSLKTSGGSHISTPEQAARLIEEMRRFRGTIEGGFCVRRVEDFKSETERRYFVLDGVAYAETGEVPAIVIEWVKRLRSRFYSVDVVQRMDGKLRVVEIGDGQVSDLVGWTPDRFASILAKHFLR
jgi:ATP-grasp domain, R2K clade family 3